MESLQDELVLDSMICTISKGMIFGKSIDEPKINSFVRVAIGNFQANTDVIKDTLDPYYDESFTIHAGLFENVYVLNFEVIQLPGWDWGLTSSGNRQIGSCIYDIRTLQTYDFENEIYKDSMGPIILKLLNDKDVKVGILEIDVKFMFKTPQKQQLIKELQSRFSIDETKLEEDIYTLAENFEMKEIEMEEMEEISVSERNRYSFNMTSNGDSNWESPTISKGKSLVKNDMKSEDKKVG